MTPEEIQIHDKRNAAFHEAGHSVVMHALGERLVRLRIFPNLQANEHDKTWVGNTEGSCFHDRNWQIVGLAGYLAENHLDNPAESPEEILHTLQNDPDCLSDSDKKRVAGYGIEHVEECLALIIAHWSSIIQAAQELQTSHQLEWIRVAEIMESNEA